MTETPRIQALRKLVKVAPEAREAAFVSVSAPAPNGEFYISLVGDNNLVFAFVTLKRAEYVRTANEMLVLAGVQEPDQKH
jgi:hypothetical protein